MFDFKYKPNLFALQAKIAKFSALWLPVDGSRRQQQFYLAYVCIVTFYTEVIYTLTEYIKLRDTSKDFDRLMDHVGMMITHTLGFIKIFNDLYNMRRIQRIMRLYESDEFHYDSIGDFNPAKTLEVFKRFNNRVTTIWFIMVNSVPVSKIIPAMFRVLMQTEPYVNGTLNCDNVLPYNSWIPFNTDSYQSCTVALLTQMVPIMYYAWQIAAHDILFMSIVYLTAGHIEVLQGVFRSLKMRCLRKLKIRNGEYILHDEEVPNLNEEMLNEFHKATKYLQSLLKYVKAKNVLYVPS